MNFEGEYKKLNAEQRQAVDTIDGPLLVIAGPGTGKTQLLSSRAANIVKQGAVGPSNILCLTYTEAGATEMRERMTRIMGPNGSEVAVFTFHSFGTWLINQYPEQFTIQRALRPLDDLTTFGILEKLLSKLPLRHPLAVHGENETFIRQHAVEEAIGAFKQAGLSPQDLRTIIKTNEKAYSDLQPLIDETFGSTLSAKRLDAIASQTEQLLKDSEPHTLTRVLLETFKLAVEESMAIGKTKPLGDWRTSHTVIKNGQRILKSQDSAKLLKDTVDIYEQYQKHLATEGRYDYEDMVLWAAKALETNEDMRLDVAERFQYLMVDEYQDTNGAQNRLLDAILGANPLDSPNVLVVGDDDQAIMRFQGAEVSGTLRFIERYKPTIITLKDNYRSIQPILDASRQIMIQTDERLETALPEMGLSKELRSNTTNTGGVTHYRYASPSVQYAAVTAHIQKLLANGVPPTEIAVIGRKHAELAEFMPFLVVAGIHAHYDGRQNILEDSTLSQLLELATYVETLTSRPVRAASLLPGVLAAPYWGLDPLATYELAARARLQGMTWLDAMLEDPDSHLGKIAEWLIACREASSVSNFTQIFDILVGREPLKNTKLGNSPFGNYLKQQDPEATVTLFAHLIRLRTAVLENQPRATSIADLLTVTQDYIRSNTRLTDANPVLQGDKAGVQVMSAHGSKGREFKHVIILSVLDNIWGKKARGSAGRIRLPENLPLYPAGDAESDKLRLLYVAMTRAKTDLLLTSYEQTDGGSKALSLSYLALGDEQESAWWQPVPQSLDYEQRQQILETVWSAKPGASRSLKQVLDPLLQNYRLSPSAVRTFLDLCYGGPQAAIEQHVLKFPSAYTASSALGSAAHDVLHKAQKAYVAGTPLNQKAIIAAFDVELDSSGLAQHELVTVREHGHQFLPACIEQLSKQDFGAITATEESLTATLPSTNISLVGALDAIVQKDNTLKIIDYKTGKPPLPEWKTTGLTEGKKISLHFYRQQLLIYKLLVDNSAKYKDARVTNAELIFVEPSVETGEFVRLTIDTFEQAELDRTARLIKAVYERITAVDLPDVSEYSKDLGGIKAFEEDLLN